MIGRPLLDRHEFDRSRDPTPEGVKKRNNSIHSAEFRWGRVPAWTGTHVQSDIPQAAPVGSPCPGSSGESMRTSLMVGTLTAVLVALLAPPSGLWGQTPVQPRAARN